MKNNKGFTLIELLAVIVILLGLSLATAWGITSILESRDEKEQEEQIELAKGAAKIYFSLQDDSNIPCVNISKLKEEGYFTNTNKTDKVKNGSVERNNNKITYKNSECS